MNAQLSHASERRVLDPSGHLLADADEPDIADDELLTIYEDMLQARRFDRRVVSLNRQGRIGSFPPMYGQEAAQVASAHALADGDWIVPSYRDHGALMTHGLPLHQILLYYMGHEAGNAIPEDVNALPINGSVGSQLVHATGMAWADVIRRTVESAYVCYFGDGATSQGFAQEAMNFAGVFDTPTVFFCQNNGWAISVPQERQTAADTFAQKAHAYGFEGVRVDGMDPLAVYETTREALAKARNPADGEPRPTLIEAVVYRLGAHSTADDPSVYRDDDEVAEWREKDPLPRMETFLRSTGRLDDERKDAIVARVDEQVDRAIETAESFGDADPRQMFEHVYAEMPDRLEAQADQLQQLRERHGDETLREGE
jgi:pyruvate dehydrogenase E1 component alpha subunit